jgi:hypothetical protein
MEKLEKIIGVLGGIVTAGVLMFASPNYADAKVTQVEKRSNGTIVRIYDDEVREAVKEEGKAGAYLYPVRFCDKCETYHPDQNRKKVELQFRTKNGRVVDYLPQTKRPTPSESNSNTPSTSQEDEKNARYGAVVEEMLGVPSPYKK